MARIEGRVQKEEGTTNTTKAETELLMTCYIEDVETPFGKPKTCQIHADSLKELERMANRLSVFRCEIEGSHDNPYFEIAAGHKKTAIALGCVET